MKTDTFTFLLTNDSRDLGTLSNPIFNINYLQKKNNYSRITCFIDNFQAMLLTLSNTTNMIYLESNLNQINSYNSKKKDHQIFCFLLIEIFKNMLALAIKIVLFHTKDQLLPSRLAHFQILLI